MKPQLQIHPESSRAAILRKTANRSTSTDGSAIARVSAVANDDVRPALTGGVKALEGTVLFLNHVFRTWPFRKLYLETPQYNLDQFASGSGRLLEEESRLRDHWYYDGQYWDHVVLSRWRERWDERGPALLRSALGGD